MAAMDDPWRRGAFGAAATPVIAQVSPALYNPYAVAPIQPLPTQRSVAGSTSPVPVAPAEYKPHDVEAPPTYRAGSPRAAEPYSGPSSSSSLKYVYAGICFILLVTIPILGMASYAVDKINNNFLYGGSSSGMYKVATDNFKRWNDALATKDYATVANMYSTQELSFLPTVSPNHIRDPISTQNYFKDFLKKLPAGTITDDAVQAFGPDAYLHTGMYTFQLGPLDARTPVEARFSYLWRKMGNDWKITHHHSSVRPAAGRRSLTPEQEEVLSFTVEDKATQIPK